MLKIELPYDPAIPLLDIYPKKTKTLTRNAASLCSLQFTTAKIQSNRWMDKEDVIKNKR